MKTIKKTGIVFLMLLFAGMQMVNAQPQQRNNPQQMSFIKSTVLPFIQKQQEQFIKVLTPKEKATLNKAKNELKAFRAQGKQIRESMNGKFNQQLWNTRKAQYQKILSQVEAIVKAHPKAAKAYTTAMEKQEAIWIQNMPMRGNANGMKMKKGMANRPNNMFSKLNNPAFALIMDTNNIQAMMKRPNRSGQRMKMQGKRGIRKNGNCNPKGMKNMRNNKMGNKHHQMMMMKLMKNPSIRKEVLYYVKNNVVPTVIKERNNFEKDLSSRERKELNNARNSLKTIEEKIISIKEKAALTGNKPAGNELLSLNIEKQKNIIVVEEIALKHYAKLASVIDNIKINIPKWKNDVRKIVMANMPMQQKRMVGQKGNHPFRNQMMMKKNSAKSMIRFLLFDPENPQGFMFAHKKGRP